MTIHARPGELDLCPFCDAPGMYSTCPTDGVGRAEQVCPHCSACGAERGWFDGPDTEDNRRRAAAAWNMRGGIPDARNAAAGSHPQPAKKRA